VIDREDGGMTGKSYSNGDAAVSYTYDQTNCLGQPSCSNIGRRTGMSDGSGTTGWTYDPVGRAAIGHRTIGGVTKDTVYTYESDPKPPLKRLPSTGARVWRRWRLERTPQPQHSSGSECQISLPAFWVLFCVAPSRKFVVRCIRLDLGNCQRRIDVVKSLPRNKVSYNPRTTIHIVIEVHQPILGNNSRAA